MRRLLLAVLVTSLGAPAFAAGAKAAPKVTKGAKVTKPVKAVRAAKVNRLPSKIDRALAGALKAGSGKQKVLVTVRPGYRATVRKALEGRGAKIKREHGRLNLLISDLDQATILGSTRAT